MYEYVRTGMSCHVREHVRTCNATVAISLISAGLSNVITYCIFPSPLLLVSYPIILSVIYIQAS